MGTNNVGDVTSAGAETRRRLALRRLGFADPPDLIGFDTIVRTAGLALDVSSACICLGESADWWILCSYGTDAAFEPFETKLRGPTGSRTELFVVEDCRMDARFAQQSVARASPAIGFYASCALIGPDRDVLGALCVMDEHERRFDARSREVLRGLAVWAQGELNAVDRERSRLEALNARLVAPAVHRTRGALTSIHGFSSFLLNQDCAPEQRQEVLGIIHDQASYLASVVTLPNWWTWSTLKSLLGGIGNSRCDPPRSYCGKSSRRTTAARSTCTSRRGCRRFRWMPTIFVGGSCGC